MDKAKKNWYNSICDYKLLSIADISELLKGLHVLDCGYRRRNQSGNEAYTQNEDEEIIDFSSSNFFCLTAFRSTKFTKEKLVSSSQFSKESNQKNAHSGPERG